MDDRRPGAGCGRAGDLGPRTGGPGSTSAPWWPTTITAASTSLRLTQRLADAGIRPSVGAVGSSYDNALAESINGLYKTEVIRRRGPWRNVEAVELATAEWVDWYNHRRLNEYCADMPPAALEQAHYAQHQDRSRLRLSNHQVSGHAGAVHSDKRYADFTPQPTPANPPNSSPQPEHTYAHQNTLNTQQLATPLPVLSAVVHPGGSPARMLEV